MIVRASEKEKREAIVANLDKSMMVEAGAGAGKTSLVVRRNIEQLKKGVLKAKDLVDITFTKAAAEELRSRLLQGLHEEVKSKDINKDERQRLDEAIADESLIQISTIHSFCKRLLTEQSFAAKIPLDVKLLDEREAIAKKRRFFDVWFKNMDVNELRQREKEFYQRNIGDFVYHSFLDICELPDDTEIVYRNDLIDNENCTLDLINMRMRRKLEECFEQLYRVVADRYPGNDYKDFDSISDCIIADYKHAHDELTGLRNTTKLVKVFKSCQKNWLEEKKAFKAHSGLGIKREDAVEMTEAFSESMGDENIVAELEAYQNALVLDLAMKARKEYREYCRLPENRHEITNDALLQEALSLVKNNPDAREYFQRKFSCIYVDEFQDTDMVQRDLIEILCQDPDAPGNRRPASLFLVGDPKQSIYAFRGADVGVYEETKGHYDKDSVTDVEEYVLDDNYRSGETIVNWVNNSFSDRFNEILSNGYSNMNSANNNGIQPGTNMIKGVYRLNYPIYKIAKDKAEYTTSKIYGGSKKAKDKDSCVLVSIIRHLTEDGFQIWDKKIERPRNISYNDFLILCSKKDDINQYANVLKKSGITVNLYGALDAGEEDVYIRFVSIYKGLTYPYDKKSKYGAEEVLTGGLITPDNSDRAKRFFDSLRERTKDLSANELLQYLCHHIEYFMGNEVTGDQAYRIQSRLQQMLENVMSEKIGSRKAVLEYIIKFLSSDVDRELSLDMDSNAVRFMNLHKAKGLEGKIVIVCARGQQKEHEEPYRDMNVYYPLARNDYYSVFSSYADNTETIEKADTKRKHERIRQEYVEATRAEEALIFLDGLGSKCVFNEYEKELLGDDVKNLLDVSGDIKNDYETILSGGYRLAGITMDSEQYDTECWKYNCSEEQHHHQQRSITPSGMENGDDSWNPGDDSEERPVGGVFGTVMHRCFELLVKCLRTDSEVDVEQIIHRTIMENYSDITEPRENDEEIQKTLQLYKSYLKEKLTVYYGNTPLIERIKGAKEAYVEMSFSMYADQNEIVTVNSNLKEKLQSGFMLDDEEPYWLNGQADLVLVGDDNKAQIIDYKTDHIGSKTVDELKAHLSCCYDHQQELYRYAVSKMLGIPISDITYQYYHLYDY